MLWLRRNLFWAVFGAASVLLLACGGWYLWSGVSGNAAVDKQIDDAKDALRVLVEAKPTPSDTNIDRARILMRQLEQVAHKEQRFFGEIPYSPQQGIEFLTVLNSNLTGLRLMASNRNVRLPSEFFAFSFESQINKPKFADRSFPVLAEQLAEVRLIITPLLEASVSSLVSVKRPKTPDDADASPYCHRLPRMPYTSLDAKLDLLICPYEVTFFAFSENLARALENLCNAERFIAVKLVSISHEEPPKGSGGPPGVPPGVRIPGRPPGVRPGPPPRPLRGSRPGVRPGAYAPPPPPPRGAGPEPGEVAYVLEDRPFKATLLLYVAKMVPKTVPKRYSP
ncbi:MAG: Amuc_1100 family pilus-like protein [Verrucomicrobia bacterium]|nr:Amuc_1100 family pilus-like protein [Verrucomicrobiota bacterium]